MRNSNRHYIARETAISMAINGAISAAVVLVLFGGQHAISRAAAFFVFKIAYGAVLAAIITPIALGCTLASTRSVPASPKDH
jgi:hypothetical protein